MRASCLVSDLCFFPSTRNHFFSQLRTMHVEESAAVTEEWLTDKCVRCTRKENFCTDSSSQKQKYIFFFKCVNKDLRMSAGHTQGRRKKTHHSVTQ